MICRGRFPLHILSIALGGCISNQPRYGLTEDTGGHITYLLGAMRALSERDDVSCAEIITRLIDDPALGPAYAAAEETPQPGLRITRIDSGNRDYLSKDRLAADRRGFTAALIRNLAARATLPDVIHAHFADAADVAVAVRERFGIPFIYTPHSLGRDKAEAAGGGQAAMAARLHEENRAIAEADAIVGSSRDECERQLMAYPAADQTRIWRVRPGIDGTPASAADIAGASHLIAPFLRAPDRPLVLAIARPVAKKNLVGLVHAFAGNQYLKATANLVILPGLRTSVESGEPEQVEVMRGLVAAVDSHDLHGQVAWPRHHAQDQVRGLYALAARGGGVFVNPALIEPFGLTLLEAAVHGLPVVATKNGGPVDIVREIEHGVLVDPHDPTAIGAAIERLLRDRTAWSRAAQNAAANIARVRWCDYADQLVRIARQVAVPFDGAATPIHRQQHLLICDIDHTLTGCRHSAGRLSRMIERDPALCFGVATGRSLVEARRLVNEWNLPTPRFWITSVGSEIHWQEGGRLRPDFGFAARLEHGWHPDLIADALADCVVLQPQSGVDQKRFKRSYFTNDARAVEMVRERLDDAGLAARIVFSHGHLLDILPAAAGKGAAMRHVAARLGLPLERVFVAGDSGNDQDMLAACPNAIVVGNCEDELRQFALAGGAYLARRHHAAGVIEGLAAHVRRMRRETLSVAA